MLTLIPSSRPIQIVDFNALRGHTDTAVLEFNIIFQRANLNSLTGVIILKYVRLLLYDRSRLCRFSSATTCQINEYENLKI